MSKLSFNINNYIYVQLKDAGYHHYMNEHNKYMPADMKRPLKYFTDQADKNGFVKFATWEFMKMFGKTIMFHTIPIFETTVMFNESDLLSNEPDVQASVATEDHSSIGDDNQKHN